MPYTADAPKKKGELQAEFDAEFSRLPPGPLALFQIRSIFDRIGVKDRYGRKLIQRHLDSGELVRITPAAGYEKVKLPVTT